MPRDPRTYRFQIREHARIPLDDAGERHEYGAVLWDEDDPIAALPDRSNFVVEQADALSEKLQRSVALGIVSVGDTADIFQAVYFVRPSAVVGVPELKVITGGAR